MIYIYAVMPVISFLPKCDSQNNANNNHFVAIIVAQRAAPCLGKGVLRGTCAQEWTEEAQHEWTHVCKTFCLRLATYSYTARQDRCRVLTQGWKELKLHEQRAYHCPGHWTGDAVRGRLNLQRHA